MEKPKRLSPGDTIGIFAPASPPEPGKLASGVAYLQRKGFKVKLGASTQGHFRSYLAAGDEVRRADFYQFFQDQDVKAIFCARGGYGSLRLLPLELPKEPKIFLGFSDLTTLHLILNKKMVSFHGPMVASNLSEPDPFTEQNLWQSLMTPSAGLLPHPQNLPPPKLIYPGSCEGVLTGGNLSLVVASLGTEHEIETQGKILLLEEVDEPSYKVDRMLRQLFLAGKLEAAEGIIFGYSPSIWPQEEFQALLLELKALKIPIVAGLAFGHGGPKLTLPLGVRARLDTEAGALALLESPLI